MVPISNYRSEENNRVNHRRSGWAIQVGTISQIPIRIHLTFLLLLAWLVLSAEGEQVSPLMEGLFVVVIFACVLLHELGHALVGKRFGVLTKDITLYPFGGVASITSQPAPKAELLIAVSGPLVNVIIALAMYPWITLPDLSHSGPITITFAARVFMTNVALAVFNLLPALPMDGGRVLRAALALMNVKRATAIAARVSQLLCIGLGLAALYIGNPILFVIAFIIFFAAMQERVRAESKVIAVAFTVREAMIPRERLDSISHGTTISKALRLALTSLQPLYPVLNADELLGVVFREDILEHAATRPDEYVGEIMTRSIPTIDLSASLADAFAQIEQSGNNLLIVTKEGHYVGLLVYDRLADFLLLHEIRKNVPKDSDVEWSTPM